MDVGTQVADLIWQAKLTVQETSHGDDITRAQGTRLAKSVAELEKALGHRKSLKANPKEGWREEAERAAIFPNHAPMIWKIGPEKSKRLEVNFLGRTGSIPGVLKALAKICTERAWAVKDPERKERYLAASLKIEEAARYASVAIGKY